MDRAYHIQIEGMGCAHCVQSVTEALSALGATVSRCSIGAADATFSGDAALLKKAIEERGFDVLAITEA